MKNIFYMIGFLLVATLFFNGCNNKRKHAHQSSSTKKKLTVGSLAPDFTLYDESGNPHTLSTMRGKSMVIYFYPSDDTPGCRKEACSIGNQYAEFTKNGITVWGISYDGIASHKKFKEKYHLPFTLLSDTTKEVAHLYGAAYTFLGMTLPVPKRVTFLIDKQGVIRAIISNVDPANHAEQILEAFKGS